MVYFATLRYHCVTLRAQDDKKQFVGRHAALMRNGAPLAAIVGPFLQPADCAGVHVVRLDVVLVGPCPALLRVLPTSLLRLPRMFVWCCIGQVCSSVWHREILMSSVQPIDGDEGWVPWDLESPAYPENLRQWQVARAKAEREGMPA